MLMYLARRSGAIGLRAWPGTAGACGSRLVSRRQRGEGQGARHTPITRFAICERPGTDTAGEHPRPAGCGRSSRLSLSATNTQGKVSAG
jgi:hypothetical protein